MVFVFSCCWNKFSSLKKYKPIMFLFCRPEDWVGSAGYSGSLKGEIKELDAPGSHLAIEAGASKLIQVVRFMPISFLALSWGSTLQFLRLSSVLAHVPLHFRASSGLLNPFYPWNLSSIASLLLLARESSLQGFMRLDWACLKNLKVLL